MKIIDLKIKTKLNTIQYTYVDVLNTFELYIFFVGTVWQKEIVLKIMLTMKNKWQIHIYLSKNNKANSQKLTVQKSKPIVFEVLKSSNNSVSGLCCFLK